jgi:hypothetical protein
MKRDPQAPSRTKRNFSRRSFLRAAGRAALLAPLAPLVRVRPAFGETPFRTRHVVVLLFGGGTRVRESIDMAEGALMPNLLGTSLLGGGDAPETRIDTTGTMGDARTLRLPIPRAAPLRTLGTLWTRVRYAAGAGGHTQGAASAVCGAYNDKGPRQDDRPLPPTLFELLRKKAELPTTATWLVRLAPSMNALTHSRHPDFGARYGASYLDPAPLIDSFALASALRRPIDPIRPENVPNLFVEPNERAAADRVRRLLDGNFPSPSERPPSTEREKLERFVIDRLLAGGYPDARPLSSTSDAIAGYATEQILSTFRPTLTFVNAFEIDAAHQNFNVYLNQIRVADAMASLLWDAIEADAELRGRTTLLVLPEHGRDSTSNYREPDRFGRRPVDHGADPGPGGFRDIWCLAIGPDIRANDIVATPVESVDVGATIAALLGLDAPYRDALGPLSAQDSLIRGGRVLSEMFR